MATDVVVPPDIEIIPGEEWRYVKGLTDFIVSDKGRIARMARSDLVRLEKNNRTFIRTRKCGIRSTHPWGDDRHFRAYMMSKRDENNKIIADVSSKLSLARSMAEAFIRDVEIGEEAYLIDGNPANAELSNIGIRKCLLYTRTCNIITPETWDQIYARKDEKIGELSKEFRLKPSLVQSIVQGRRRRPDPNGKRWRGGGSSMTKEMIFQIINDTRHIKIIASELNLTETSVYALKMGKTWSWISGIKRKPTRRYNIKSTLKRAEKKAREKEKEGVDS